MGGWRLLQQCLYQVSINEVRSLYQGNFQSIEYISLDHPGQMRPVNFQSRLAPFRSLIHRLPVSSARKRQKNETRAVGTQREAAWRRQQALFLVFTGAGPADSSNVFAPPPRSPPKPHDEDAYSAKWSCCRPRVFA